MFYNRKNIGHNKNPLIGKRLNKLGYLHKEENSTLVKNLVFKECLIVVANNNIVPNSLPLHVSAPFLPCEFAILPIKEAENASPLLASQPGDSFGQWSSSLHDASRGFEYIVW